MSALDYELLLVEDGVEYSFLLRYVFEQEGFRVRSFMLGKKALDEVIDGLYYDVAVVDASLPDIDGLDVIRDLKRYYPSRGVILYSGYPFECYEADKVLMKNGSSEELIREVKRLCNR